MPGSTLRAGLLVLAEILSSLITASYAISSDTVAGSAPYSELATRAGACAGGGGGGGAQLPLHDPCPTATPRHPSCAGMPRESWEEQCTALIAVTAAG
jgi:hypothetical protein